ncbi:hypothetical protein ACLB2K_069071 [Fragaria x ananassa]
MDVITELEKKNCYIDLPKNPAFPAIPISTPRRSSRSASKIGGEVAAVNFLAPKIGYLGLSSKQIGEDIAKDPKVKVPSSPSCPPWLRRHPRHGENMHQIRIGVF